ncbi:hypothetical protein DJ013_04075 [Arcticibacterium luteifluviistationis]|uniref:Uncharacterized protein n=1 Tax=Arcticibacterium luteifluviistationis TaxID=1784714 RepID=A0A2Z4GHI1_9BACT|nr:hypothetical protein DJ013_04075 [Arcticibacterium luteifluviistationis]
MLSIMLVGTVSQSAFAQDNSTDNHDVGLTIPEVALLDLEKTGGDLDITLTFTAPNEAGEKLDFSTASTTDEVWLNYSSIVGVSGVSVTSRKVTVKASPSISTFPADLKVIAAADASNGDGTIGTPTAAVTLTDSDQDLITGIGSAYTGTGPGNGHKLTYTVAAKTGGDYADLRYGTEKVTVTYTLSDDTVAL